MTVYKSVIERILEHDNTLEPELLRDIDMNSDSQLFMLFSACYDSNNTKAVSWILDNIRDPSQYVDPESNIFTIPIMSTQLLTFIVTSHPNRFSLANCIDCLIQLDATNKTYSACVKALEVLGDTDFISWVNFAMTAEDIGNETVWEFCQLQAKRQAPYKKKPRYMIHAPNLLKLGDMAKIEVNPPASATNRELNDEVKKLENDIERFRFLGPCNVMCGARSREVLNGQMEMRMFEDNRFVDDADDQFTNWFTGNCDECWYKIKCRRYAVRKPLSTGGWIGQFCSWNCVRLNCDDTGELVEKEMTLYYEEQMNKNKIYNNISKK